ncbi:MAG: hypothetical protein ACRCUI_10945 [Polymorphobacter sp.]
MDRLAISPRAAALLLFGLVAACAPPLPPPAPLPPPSPGLERVTGQPATAATALFGAPSLDRSEPPARMLQFARPPCVLDVYYYPPATGAVAVARHIEARTPDGKPMDAGACATAIAVVAPVVAAPDGKTK